uniref:Uncharacterized protein n=1 Tax=Acrobeloides nanus TaxID=290746 RepID=A0A914DSP1_9BILA
EKLGDADSASESSGGEDEPGTSEKKLSNEEILKIAAEEAAKSDPSKEKLIRKASENPWLRSELSKIREKRKKNSTKNSISAKNIDDIIDNDESNFLKIQTTEVNEVPVELIDKMEEVDGMETQADFLAAAFEDDDVVADFEAEKEAVEANEKPQNIDLTLHGWGDWTGPGITDKKKDKFIVKAPEQKRRDKNRIGVIIRETADKSIEKFQPKIVPFPFTKASDFEAYIQQPIGRDWNTELTHVKLIKPSVVTQAGRIIRPLDKEAVIKERMVKEMSSSEDEY